MNIKRFKPRWSKRYQDGGQFIIFLVLVIILLLAGIGTALAVIQAQEEWVWQVEIGKTCSETINKQYGMNK